MPEISERLNGFTESVIRKMTRIANKYDAINLSQGFPDFDPPKEIKEALIKVAEEGPHQYEITWGSQKLREALSKKQTKFMGIPIDPNKEIVVTCGSTEAMMVSMMTVCNPGDKVVVFSPFYENYGADAILCGADPIYVPLNPPHFNFDKEELENAFKQNPKAIILCNPSNPTGKVFTLEELQFIADLAKKYDTFVITDEVYEHIVMKPHKHQYMAAIPGMFERTISCSSLSKTYAITGWRIGYVIAPEHIIENAKKVHDFLTVGAAAPLQAAVLAGLNLPDEYYESLRELYTQKRELFLNGLDEAGLKYTKPDGAYYVMVDISEFTEGTDMEFCEWLAKEVGVAAVPGSSFFKEDVNNFIRFHFAKKDDTLIEAVRRLKTLKEKVRNRKA
ncbi:pyridoxal phosphate-dependent aminotransferase [Clostridium arbusti]|uniref:pyridoxal phosphate-dependent aminotransferase n=1 Tax=Clostridium arbusti TaxID=1137848 RepID=UPI0002899CD7|nr:pyridoxal phosphate-dependent aminotransferase [Clostridium arbusti]